jgi:signal transduction histidine kinase
VPVSLTVVPRDVAARVISAGVARGALATSAANLILTIPLLLEFAASRELGWTLAGLLAIVVVLSAAAIVAGIWPRPAVVAGYLALATVGAIAFQFTLITTAPDVTDGYFFLLNRPAVSLVLVGVAGAGWLTGAVWSLGGFALSLGASGIVALATGTPFRTGLGPLLMLGMCLVAYFALAGIQASQRRRVPDFDQHERETRRQAALEGARSRMAATVHDTLLSDLAVIMSSADRLDDRTVVRLRSDLAIVGSARWRQESSAIGLLDADGDELRGRIARLVGDFQWRGLSVQVVESGSHRVPLDPRVATALVEAVRSVLENVLIHAGTPVAEVAIGATEDEITVMISDGGVGFDPLAVPRDRLGLRTSVVARVEEVGGTVRVWSAPGAGSSIMLRVPLSDSAPEDDPRA